MDGRKTVALAQRFYVAEWFGRRDVPEKTLHGAFSALVMKWHCTSARKSPRPATFRSLRPLPARDWEMYR